MKIRNIKGKTGTPPGTIIYTGKKKITETEIEVLEYNEKEFKIDSFQDPDKILFTLKDVQWVNYYGLNDVEKIQLLAKKMNINHLVIEDITNIGQRSKIEFHEEYVFLVLNMIEFDKKSEELDIEQISILFKDNSVIIFQEKQGDIFNNIRNRIIYNEGIIRAKESDYLIYSIIDSIVDNYLQILIILEEEIEFLEDEIIKNNNKEILNKIYKIRKELNLLKISIIPLKEIVNEILNDVKFFSKDNNRYFKDILDNLLNANDYLQIFKENITGLYEIYYTEISNKLNKTIMTLTIFSALFIPLTFITGVFGMNFKFMPGLSYENSFLIFCAVCLLISFGMYNFFRKKNWF